MSYRFPASLELEIERYAQSEHLTPDEAATRLIQEALKAKSEGEITDKEWERLREIDPAFAFFESLPATTVDTIEESYKRIRNERIVPRG
ncbi:hypothetical protein BH11ARM2_BH11ARM2_10020 [soil metagenome]